MNKIKIVDNYIEQEEALYLISVAEKDNSVSVNSKNIGAKDFIDDENAYKILKKYSNLTKQNFIDLYELDKNIYIFKALGFKWNEGYSQQPHIDAYGPGKSIKWSCVIYLNDDYEGGEIAFPNKKFIHKPKQLSAIFFPGNDEEYLHHVSLIKSNNRYSLLFLFTDDINDAHKDFL